jgi:hypothetical protein
VIDHPWITGPSTLLIAARAFFDSVVVMAALPHIVQRAFSGTARSLSAPDSRVEARRPSLELGKWSILHRLGVVYGITLKDDRDVIIKTVRAALVLSKETQSVPQRKDTMCMPPNRPPWAYWDYAPRAAGRLR